MTTQKYVSRIGLEKNYVYAPGLYWQLDWQQIQADWPDPRCFLFALDDRQIEVLLNLLTTFPYFYRNWGFTKINLDPTEWDEIQTFIAELEGCLMSGCDVQFLIKSNLLVAAALSGDTVDLDADLGDILTGVKSYADTGVSPQFLADSSKNIADVAEDAAEQQSVDLNAIKDALGAIETALLSVEAAIEAAGIAQDLEDDLANVWFTVKAVATILGASVGAPPTPL